MDLRTYAKKFEQPAKLKSGDPRSEREELLLKFKAQINADRLAAGYSAFSDTRIAIMFKGYPTDRLHLLYSECDKAQKFGGLLKFKLDAFHKGV